MHHHLNFITLPSINLLTLPSMKLLHYCINFQKWYHWVFYLYSHSRPHFHCLNLQYSCSCFNYHSLNWNYLRSCFTSHCLNGHHIFQWWLEEGLFVDQPCMTSGSISHSPHNWSYTNYPLLIQCNIFNKNQHFLHPVVSTSPLALSCLLL